MASLIASVTLGAGAAPQTVAVAAATLVTGECSGYFAIKSSNGVHLWQNQKEEDAFAIIAPSNELVVHSIGSGGTVDIYGLLE